MTKNNTGFTWEKNNFQKDIRQRLERVWENFSGEEMSIDGRTGMWKQVCSPRGASQIALLQNRYIAVDFTDRGFGICPMILDGRYYGRIGFDFDCDGRRFSSYPWERTSEYESGENGESGKSGKSDIEVSAVYELDSFTLRGISSGDFEFEIKVALPPSFPFILVDIKVKGRGTGSMSLTPWLMWMPGELQPAGADALWLVPAHTEIADRVLANNNSQTADPVRQDGNEFAGIGIAYDFGRAKQGMREKSGIRGTEPEIRRRSKPETPTSVLLCDRLFSPETLEKLEFGSIPMHLEDGVAHFSMVFGISRNAEDFGRELAKWRRLDAASIEREKTYWNKIRDHLSIVCPDKDIELQSIYSVKNSLFSRCVFKPGLTVFIHGRPDRGYGDCSKLHQSYQMHYAALAAGETDSVREELEAFAMHQACNGDMAIQLKPGGGCHPYAGLYSNAHYIMALYRYLVWTGDFDFLKKTVLKSEGTECILLESMLLSAKWLRDNFSNGVVKPCGWLDAWPPTEEAQAQVSIAAYIAFDELSKILSYTGFKEEEAFYKNAAKQLEEDIKSVFYNKDSGLFAEHLFNTGRVAGGTIEDFYSHTQIWAALAGLAPDVRGLEACRKYCLKRGMAVIPESGLYTDYIGDSTDGLEELDLGSTATWLLADWPEVTHLYAIAEIKYGRIDEGLDTIERQLPRHVNRENPYVPPYYYAEKYLYPYDFSWLCTWSGDPTLIQALMEGFGGIQPSFGGLRIQPVIPEAWRGKGDYSVHFIWRGRKIKLTINGCGSTVKRIALNGRELGADTNITSDMLKPDSINILDVTIR